MTDFISTLSKKLAERWLTLLVLPGVLYLAAAATAAALGQGVTRSLSLRGLVHQVGVWAKAPAAVTTGGQIVLLGAVLAGSAATGLAAQALGWAVESLSLAANWRAWPVPLRNLAKWRVGARRTKWTKASADYQSAREEAAEARTRGQYADPDKRRAAFRRVIAVARIQPDRPTWSGDRMHAMDEQLRAEPGVDLPQDWPTLWIGLEDAARKDITEARTALTRATTLGGWAVLYAVLVIWWWPAVVAGAVTAVTARHRIRTAADTYAELVAAVGRRYAAAERESGAAN
ncbi:hypothetical protein [Catenulispora rubra]|uniref:hypothetical protein n=1 Tax=Catenulispora rubra TaxID=280293 RepID=UPI0018923746|nr:hypothetical protein [Catenulispora rubra]